MDMERPGLANVPNTGTLALMRGRAVVTMAIAGLATAIGCNAFLSLDDYDIKPRDGGVDTRAACWVRSEVGGHECFQCDASTMNELLNACTTAQCMSFHNAERIAGYDGGVPPDPEAGIEQDAIVTDGGVPTSPPSCASLPNPVYVAGSTGLDTILVEVGRELKDLTIVMQAMPSCAGVDVLLDEKPLGGIADYYGATGPGKCVIDGEPLPQAAVAFSDVPLGTCRPVMPSDVSDITGPIQVFSFAVPKPSTQNVISREAAFRVFGYSADSGVTPWDDPNYIFRRHPESGTQIVIGENIGLAARLWSGVRVQSSRSMPAVLQKSTQPAKTIGITSADQSTTDEGKDSMRTLAYQHAGQACGYHPDHVFPNGFDKRNVRDGHYALWAPIHMLARGSGGIPITDARAKRLIRFIDGTSENFSSKYLSTLKKGHLVPLCAMAVQRDTPGGDIRPFLPSPSCDCAFERADWPTDSSGCTGCVVNSDCKDKSRPICRAGLCERG